ncbi:hypothetical protein [Streptomyces scopuliridis]|uniref:hypothetical protein n=1 Tax=Streptomyces scopuliridis TaxID=452529 RepID=UPI003427C9C3
MAPFLALMWLCNWLIVSGGIVYFVKNCPPQADTDFLLWDLEDNLPLLVAVMLIAWPIVMARLLPVVLPTALRILRDRHSGS